MGESGWLSGGSQDGLVVINHAFHLCDMGSTLGPKVLCGLSFSQSQSDSGGFSPGTSPSSKSTLSQLHLAAGGYP